MAHEIDVVLNGTQLAQGRSGLRLDDPAIFPILSFTGEHTVDLPDTLVKTVWAAAKGR
jgi:hypothetical protein